ncbi:superinfection immunity protein [Helicobacter cholecystus]|uniref:Superinfection immunity protein n=1 Tax=Helicobacter cholecystus TaxID=45498 RepID=A0A3D8IYA7_9HELI|nr:superinfection immunity protein [Helicobacter cholecystus]RDU70033.1 superinfection immunity protein [Helicobacter cholecystus]
MEWIFILLGLLFLILLIRIFFLPARIAHSKNTRNKRKILLSNLFLGWTLISWFIILLWAINDKEEEVNV